jgi:hypothetical protein
MDSSDGWVGRFQNIGIYCRPAKTEGRQLLRDARLACCPLNKMQSGPATWKRPHGNGHFALQLREDRDALLAFLLLAMALPTFVGISFISLQVEA